MAEQDPGHDWTLPEWGAVLLATDPIGVGGMLVRGPAGPEMDGWRSLARDLIGPGQWTAVAPSVELEHLVGALDVEATLAAGAPRRRPGILERGVGSVLEVRWPAFLGRESAHALVRARHRIGVVAIQPTVPDGDTDVWGGLAEALALWLHIPPRWLPPRDPDPLRTAAARGRRLTAGRSTAPLPRHRVAEIVAASARLGIHDPRTVSAVARLARIAARVHPTRDDGADPIPGDREIAVALALVAVGRTGGPTTASPPATEESASGGETRASEPDAADSAESPGPQEEEISEAQGELRSDRGATRSGEESDASRPGEGEDDPATADRLLDAAATMLPNDLLDVLAREGRGLRRGAGNARSAPRRASAARVGRGRTLRAERGRPGRGRRLHVLETLRAAAPRQGDREPGAPIRIRPEDLRVRVVERKDPATVVFAVDASGSQAAARLGEVKGAVELLLTDSYRRRDHVALVAFRGDDAEVLLPPTRSLTRVRRAVGGLPGGGGTPLAAGLTVAARTADGEVRMGRRPLLVVLTDGRPNVAMGEGRAGREHAREDALSAARSVAERGWPTLLVDSSRRPRPFTSELAAALEARVVRLPSRDPSALSDAVRTAASDAGSRR